MKHPNLSQLTRLVISQAAELFRNRVLRSEICLDGPTEQLGALKGSIRPHKNKLDLMKLGSSAS